MLISSFTTFTSQQVISQEIRELLTQVSEWLYTLGSLMLVHESELIHGARASNAWKKTDSEIVQMV